MNAPAPSAIIERLTHLEFHNALRILLNLDFRDLVQAGVFAAHDDAGWEPFQRDPFRYFIRTDDATAARIWDLIQTRQPRRASSQTSLK